MSCSDESVGDVSSYISTNKQLPKNSSEKPLDDDQEEPFPEILLTAVENILEYDFKDKEYLKQALTHSSVEDHKDRLRFVGAAALNLAISKHLYLVFTDIEPDNLAVLRDFYLSTNELAEIAICYNLYDSVCYPDRALFAHVHRYASGSGVEKLEKTVAYRGVTNAPKFLADIVESITGAIFLDDNTNLATVWKVLKNILGPIVPSDVLNQQPQQVDVPEIPQTEVSNKISFPSDFPKVVENVLGYLFPNRHRKLLEEALTHPSIDDGSVSYRRLKFIGATALRLCMSLHLYYRFTDIDTKQLSLLLAANLSTDKLACGAVDLKLNSLVRHSDPTLFALVDRFVEKKDLSYGEKTMVTKVLAEIFESMAGALYMEGDSYRLWLILSGYLEPIITLNDLNKQPQLANTLSEVNVPNIHGEPEITAKCKFPDECKASKPVGGLFAILAKKRKFSLQAPDASLEIPNSQAPELAPRRSERARVKKVKVPPRPSPEQVMEAYGDEIVGMMNQIYFESHVRALTLARVEPMDPRWYNVEFPFEGTTPKLKFPWEVEGDSHAGPQQ